MKIQLLNDLYTTFSPSFKPTAMSTFIQSKLDAMNIKYLVDNEQQIYSINHGTPLMVAHMDQVQSKKCHKVMSLKNKIYGFNAKGKLTGLGADDKNGIFIVLNMIEKFRDEISFIFSADEEVGGKLHLLMDDLQLNTLKAPYCLVFDRKGNKDIIGTSNQYCCDDLEIAIQVIGSEYGYKPARGIFSDCDEISKWIPCVNLSCGYYEAHTVNEHTKPSELWKALRLAETLIMNLPKKNAPFEVAEQWDNKWDTGWEDYLKDTKKSTSPIDDEPTLEIDFEGIYLYDGLGEEHFIADTIDEARGVWTMDGGAKLQVLQDSEGRTTAYLNRNEIEVHDYMEELNSMEEGMEDA